LLYSGYAGGYFLLASRKRGAVTVPLQSDDAERRYLVEPVDPATPEKLYERRWVLTVIDRVLAECGTKPRPKAS
jgi:hypothetical protein